jgi:hypothetical protein
MAAFVVLLVFGGCHRSRHPHGELGAGLIHRGPAQASSTPPRRQVMKAASRNQRLAAPGVAH